MSDGSRTAERAGVSTFGNWRRPASPGLLGLGLLGTLALLAGLIVTIVLTLFSRPAAIVWAVATVAFLVPVSIRRDGRSGWSRLLARLAWARGRRRRAHLYRSGIVGVVSTGRHTLPGVAAATELLDSVDAYDRPMGLIHVPSSGHYAVVLRCDADGAGLVDPEQVETWVAAWGLWLANLAHEPGLAGATVTVETAPDPGTRLAAEVSATVRPDSPRLARAVMSEIVASYPTGSSSISTRVQLVYRAGGPGGVAGAEAMAVELGSRVPVLAGTLATTGAGVATPMSAAEIAETVRVGYDPAAALLIDAARAEGDRCGPGIGWADAGPVAAQEAWDHYRHDSGVSSSWVMSQAPRGTVLSGVLSRLVGPHPDIARKRVTLVYRPHDPGTAAQLVEADVRSAQFLATSRRQGSARDDLALRSARQSAAEEAAGAGVVRFSLLVTLTVDQPGQRQHAERVLEGLGATARLQLRRAWGAQAVTFAAGLPTGIILPEHVRVPTVVREGLQ